MFRFFIYFQLQHCNLRGFFISSDRKNALISWKVYNNVCSCFSSPKQELELGEIY